MNAAAALFQAGDYAGAREIWSAIAFDRSLPIFEVRAAAANLRTLERRGLVVNTEMALG
jgi:hypothetical protein